MQQEAHRDLRRVFFGLLQLFFCLALSSLQARSALIPLTLVAVTGAFVSGTFGKKGVLLSCLALPFTLFFLPSPFAPFWWVGLLFALALSWLILALACQSIAEKFLRHGQEHALLEQQQKEAHKLLAEQHSALQRSSQECLVLKTQHERQEKESARLRTLLLHSQDQVRALEPLKEELRQLQEHHARLAHEKQEHASCLERTRADFAQDKEHLEKRCIDAEALLAQDKNRENESLLKQLRAQFEEKSAALRQSRKEAFALETKLLAWEKEHEHGACEADQELVLLAKNNAELLLQCQEMERHICQLEDVVTNLTSQPKKARSSPSLLAVVEHKQQALAETSKKRTTRSKKKSSPSNQGVLPL